MFKKWTSSLALSLFFGVMAHSGVVNAAGDATAGAGKVAACAACHGAEGVPSVAIYPKLAGQDAAVIESALKAFRAGERTEGMAAMMTPQAANLSDQDIADIAAHYSAL
ncbi:c-type cytochrome [Oceanisphaera sp. W20_SRM_FM3]|uniref:c-type cytochrome n=1 Tax=Oceanisphaera sp. W20_SRM_FM3 TaxID=3240267 RepID=UPI003F97B48F